jgi:hypothetical protein
MPGIEVIFMQKSKQKSQFNHAKRRVHLAHLRGIVPVLATLSIKVAVVFFAFLIGISSYFYSNPAISGVSYD